MATEEPAEPAREERINSVKKILDDLDVIDTMFANVSGAGRSESFGDHKSIPGFNKAMNEVFVRAGEALPSTFAGRTDGIDPTGSLYRAFGTMDFKTSASERATYRKSLQDQLNALSHPVRDPDVHRELGRAEGDAEPDDEDDEKLQKQRSFTDLTEGGAVSRQLKNLRLAKKQPDYKEVKHALGAIKLYAPKDSGKPFDARAR